MNEDDKKAMKAAWQQWHTDIDPDLVPNVNFSFEVGFEAGMAHARGVSEAVITADVEHDDMAEVGRALMRAISTHAPKGWAPADCPSEIVGDLRNALDESIGGYSKGVRDGLGMAASELEDWACEMDSVSPEAASELREHAASLRGDFDA